MIGMWKQKSRGFTLIELLVVIAILGLLSSIIFVEIRQVRFKSFDVKRKLDVEQIYNALTLYYDDHDGKLPFSGISQEGGPGYSLYGANSVTVTEPDCSVNPNSWHDLASSLSPYLPTLPIPPQNSDYGCWPAYMYYVFIDPLGNPVSVDFQCNDGDIRRAKAVIYADLWFPSGNCGDGIWQMYFLN